MKPAARAAAAAAGAGEPLITIRVRPRRGCSNAGLEELHSGGQFWYSHKTDLYRLWILERFGGVYLDTDVILQKPIKTAVFGPHVLGLEQGSLQPEKSHETVVVNSTDA